MGNLNLTFDPGAPLDATKLMQLVNAVTSLEANTLSLQSTTDSLSNANKVASARISAGVKDVGTVTYNGAAIPIDVTFNPSISPEVGSVQITLEGPSNMDLIAYILAGSINTSGCKVMLNRVAGIAAKDNKVFASSSSYAGVKIHYTAIAKVS